MAEARRTAVAAETGNRTPDLLLTEAAIEGRWFVRPNELERLTGIKATTIRDAIYRGELEARKFRGRGWLITVDAARQWIEEQTVSNRPEADGVDSYGVA